MKRILRIGLGLLLLGTLAVVVVGRRSAASTPNRAVGSLPSYPTAIDASTHALVPAGFPSDSSIRTTVTVTASTSTVVTAYRAQWEAAGWRIYDQRDAGATTIVSVSIDFHNHDGVHCFSWGTFQVSPDPGAQDDEGSVVAVNLVTACADGGFIY